MKIPKDVFERALASASSDSAGRREDAPFKPEQFAVTGLKPVEREKFTVKIDVNSDLPTAVELGAQSLSKIKRNLRHKTQSMPPSLQRRRLKQQIRDVDAVLKAISNVVQISADAEPQPTAKRYAG